MNKRIVTVSLLARLWSHRLLLCKCILSYLPRRLMKQVEAILTCLVSRKKKKSHCMAIANIKHK